MCYIETSGGEKLDIALHDTPYILYRRLYPILTPFCHSVAFPALHVPRFTQTLQVSLNTLQRQLVHRGRIAPFRKDLVYPSLGLSIAKRCKAAGYHDSPGMHI